ncbi:MAG: M67 family metallopeptidase [Candidatus Hadarchaeales archaeon]
MKIRKMELDEIFRHSEACYPFEACGILIGRKTGKEKVVEKVILAKNVLSSPVEYEVDAESLFKAFELAERNGLEVLGFFHSHPHHEPFWSSIDEERSKYWVDHSFLIVSPALRRFKSYEKRESGTVEEELRLM